MTTTLNVGSILQGGRYRIIDVLGQGGFGITYLGIQSGLERKVAIKEFYMKEFCAREAENSRVTIGTEGARTMVERFREKFVNEARKLAQLNHTHIVRVIDVFQENDTAYYVMEYADGGSLSQVVKRQGALSQPLAVRYAKEVASALQYIHDRRMNHLDIKPGNIMLNEKGETIVIDFGMSKHYDATTGNETSTTPVGISDGYAPLEQYRPGGVGEFSPQTDIYALGATLYFLLTAQKPPTASDVNEDGLPVGLLRQNGVSDSLIAVVTKAMGPRKRDRYATAQAMNDELKDEDNEIAAIVEDDETVPVIGVETDLERNAREEAARQEAERKAREEAAREEAEHKAREEAARQEAERKAREEAAREEAERNAREEAAREEAERKAREEAAREEAERKAREEAAPKASDKGRSKLWIGIGVASLIGIGAAIGFGTKSNDVDVLEETDAAVTTVEDDQSKSASSNPAPKITASYANGVLTVGSVTYNFVYVEGGTFTMGATPEQEEPRDAEKPAHRVTLSSYMIGQTEVTQELWQAVMGSNPSYFKGATNPVEVVSWNDCQDFVRKLSSLTGKSFRLPTEAEWEFAARGGNKSRGYQYSGSNTLGDVAWYDDNSDVKTHPVATKAPNELGIHDMSGNVLEWCQDWDCDYSSSAQTNPQGPSSGSGRVYRGGSWSAFAWSCRSSFRGSNDPTFRNGHLGLRLAL